jgi:hypothetical protein
MDIFEQIKQYILVTNNGKGEFFTKHIEGITSTVDTISIHYSSKGTALRVAEKIDNEFNVIVNVVNDLAIGIVTVFIIV